MKRVTTIVLAMVVAWATLSSTSTGAKRGPMPGKAGGRGRVAQAAPRGAARIGGAPRRAGPSPRKRGPAGIPPRVRQVRPTGLGKLPAMGPKSHKPFGGKPGSRPFHFPPSKVGLPHKPPKPAGPINAGIVWRRPVVYPVAPRWVYWAVSVWKPLPLVSCGTWVDVQPVVVGAEYDLQMLAIRFVDAGHPEERLGPQYRVWFRNNSTRAIRTPFNVMLFASADGVLSADLPQSGVRVTAIEAGQVQAVDIRLPVGVHSIDVDENGQPAPFSTLHALVDAAREVPEVYEANNGAKVGREEILPIDPVAFAVERGDGIAANPVTVTLTPPALSREAAPSSSQPLP